MEFKTGWGPLLKKWKTFTLSFLGLMASMRVIHAGEHVISLQVKEAHSISYYKASSGSPEDEKEDAKADLNQSHLIPERKVLQIMARDLAGGMERIFWSDKGQWSKLKENLNGDTVDQYVQGLRMALQSNPLNVIDEKDAALVRTLVEIRVPKADGSMDSRPAYMDPELLKGQDLELDVDTAKLELYKGLTLDIYDRLMGVDDGNGDQDEDLKEMDGLREKVSACGTCTLQEGAKKMGNLAVDLFHVIDVLIEQSAKGPIAPEKMQEFKERQAICLLEKFMTDVCKKNQDTQDILSRIKLLTAKRGLGSACLTARDFMDKQENKEKKKKEEDVKTQGGGANNADAKKEQISPRGPLLTDNSGAARTSNPTSPSSSVVSEHDQVAPLSSPAVVHPYHHNLPRRYSGQDHSSSYMLMLGYQMSLQHQMNPMYSSSQMSPVWYLGSLWTSPFGFGRFSLLY